jgi:hypothetical protein
LRLAQYAIREEYHNAVWRIYSADKSTPAETECTSKHKFRTNADERRSKSTLRRLLQKDEKKSRKWLDIAQIVVPSLLTGLVAFLVWYSQNSLSNEIATTNQAVSTRYVLTQEYDKEKFKVYQRAMERLTKLEGSLKGAKYGSKAKSHAIAAKNSLDAELMRTEFYFTPDMFKELNRVSYLAAQTHDLNPDATGQTSAVIEQIAVVKKKIRDDVRAEMGKLSAQKP